MNAWRKSSFCQAEDCVEIAMGTAISFTQRKRRSQMEEWRTSSFTNKDYCVEVSHRSEDVLIRNSLHPDRGTLTFDSKAMRHWIEGIKHGDLG